MSLLPPSLPLSLSLGFCLGAVRALLQSYGKEHIQWGLSQSLSVSIKDPGNTTLSTFKGPVSLLNLDPRLGLPAPPFFFHAATGIFVSESAPPECCVNFCRQWGPPSTTQLGCPNTHSSSGQLRRICSGSIYWDCSRWCLTLFGWNFANIFKEIHRFSRHKPSLTLLSRVFALTLYLCTFL